MHAGLLPVKPLTRAKRRLAPRFDHEAREHIARALLLDALDLCRSVSRVRWWVVTGDEQARRLAAAVGLEVLPDRARSLNGALRDALGAVTAAGASSAIVVPADVPLAEAEDVHDLLDTGATSDVVVVPSVGGRGTNALFMSPPALLDPRFGPGSLRTHVAVAESMSLRCSILALPRLARDIDTPEDVRAFLEADKPRSHTARALRRLRAANRGPASV